MLLAPLVSINIQILLEKIFFEKKQNLKKPNNARYDDEGDIVCWSVSSMIDGKPKEIMIGGWRKSWRAGRNGRRGWGEERVMVRGGRIKCESW